MESRDGTTVYQHACGRVQNSKDNFHLNGFSSLQETLTGFKWMANRTCEILAQNEGITAVNKKHHLLLGFEEAIGYG